MLRIPALVCLALAALVPASAAEAATLVATPAGNGTSCTAAAPCSLVTASAQAQTGDRILVAPGEHAIGSQLYPATGVEVSGDPAQPRPRIVANGGLGGPALTIRGGTVRHVDIDSTAAGRPALLLDGGLGEDLVLAGDTSAVTVKSSPSATVLRDAVVRTVAVSGGGGAVLTTDSLAGGTVALRNVTAWATANAGIRCETASHTTSIVNSIARGKNDITAATGTPGCELTASNFRLATSKMWTGSGNQDADPLFADPGAGDFRLRAGSPAIDAGTPDALLGQVDPDGRPRVLGGAPDMGAYEFPADAPATTTSGDGDAAPADTAAPRADAPYTGPLPLPGAPGHDAGDLLSGTPAKLGRSFVLTETEGHVYVRRPGTQVFVPAAAGAAGLPNGTVIDARNGTVLVESALPGGGVQVGAFRGSQFVVRQPRDGRGMTHVFLRGRLACPTAKTVARAAATKRRVRTLWARDRHGRFTTHGATSIATARGTEWVTTDSCAGTRTRVIEGAVDVRRKRGGKAVRVEAGESRLVRVRRR